MNVLSEVSFKNQIQQSLLENTAVWKEHSPQLNSCDTHKSWPVIYEKQKGDLSVLKNSLFVSVK